MSLLSTVHAQSIYVYSLPTAKRLTGDSIFVCVNFGIFDRLYEIEERQSNLRTSVGAGCAEVEVSSLLSKLSPRFEKPFSDMSLLDLLGSLQNQDTQSEGSHRTFYF